MNPASPTKMDQPATGYGKRGLLVRLIYLAIALAWWVSTGFGRLVRTRSIVLCYHGVLDQYKERFRRQMELAARQITSPAELNESAKAKRGRPRVCVTFDDAFENLLTNALPTTRELGIHTTVFAVSGNLGCRPRWEIAPDHPDASELTMTEHQIRAAAAAGLVTFGSHGSTHRPLTELLSGEVRNELVASKAELERITGAEVQDFAFPYGEYDTSLIKAAFAARYRRAFTLDPAGTRTDGAGGIIGRMPMSPAAWEVEFRLTISGAYEWLPYLRKAARGTWLALCRVQKADADRIPAANVLCRPFVDSSDHPATVGEDESMAANRQSSFRADSESRGESRACVGPEGTEHCRGSTRINCDAQPTGIGSVVWAEEPDWRGR